MATFVYSKTPEERVEVVVDLSSTLSNDLDSAKIVSIYPDTSSSSPFKAKVKTKDQTLVINASGGCDSTTYGIALAVKDVTGNITAINVAFAVNSNPLFSLKTNSPSSFMDLVGSVQAGSSAISQVSFKMPLSVDAQDGYIIWELFDVDSNVLASGNAYSYAIRNDGITNDIAGECLINVPSTLEPTTINSRYQIRYTLVLKENEPVYQFETLRVDGNFTVPIGITDTVELQGSKANMEIVIPAAMDSVVLELYNDNSLLTSLDLSANGEQVASGWKYGAIIDTSTLEVSLVNYDVVFKYHQSSHPNNVYEESAKLWVVNPSIVNAARDVLEKINKARMTLYGAPDLIYTMPCVMTWLRRAGDRFNGSYGIITTFTFTNAKAGVREYWLMWAELMALESQYLAEGEKAFDFSGAAISLNVDRTQYLDTVRGNLQSALDNEFKPFKQNLTIKGDTGGDGSDAGDTSGGVTAGSMGSIGITITPATGWGRYYPGNYYTKWF